MSQIRKYNPALKNKLRLFVEAGRGEQLLGLLEGLSVTERRTAHYLLAEEVLPEGSGETFWQLFRTIVPTNTKAYLGTFLKAAVRLYASQKMVFDFETLASFSEKASQIDRQKILSAFLPILKTVEYVEGLLHAFQVDELNSCSIFLVKADTPPCCYVLFRLMQKAEHAEVRPAVMQLIRQNTPLSFKMASFAVQYFGLSDMPGTFSLRVAPYELSRAEQGYQPFLQTLQINHS